jgi:hypothetical protein
LGSNKNRKEAALRSKTVEAIKKSEENKQPIPHKSITTVLKTQINS